MAYVLAGLKLVTIFHSICSPLFINNFHSKHIIGLGISPLATSPQNNIVACIPSTGDLQIYLLLQQWITIVASRVPPGCRGTSEDDQGQAAGGAGEGGT
jgi:hypothetical protein